MPTKVSIVQFDLGASADDIISEAVQEITGKSREILDESIAYQKALKEAKENKEKERKETIDNVSNAMDGAYNKLVEAGENGVATEIILEMVTPVIANASAFSLRMKRILKEKGNDYILERKKVQGIMSYVFSPFNLEPTD